MIDHLNDIKVKNGILRGSLSEIAGVLVFKGIPYAAPPTGPLRWKSPQPVSPWDGIKDATKFGASCWGPRFPGFFVDGQEQSEDCLSLNVWTPAPSPSAKLPVMVWIHGGGFEFGSSDEEKYNGAKLAAKGVVLVSINYRLGVFGFLAHEALDKEENPSGNFGLQDQIAALNWIQLNIENFGGDTANVTIFGESAGAHSVGLLMTSGLAEGLFHRAIGESGAFWDSEHGSISTAAEARSRGQKLTDRLAGGDINVMRQIPAEELNEITKWNFMLDPGVTAFSPSIDNYVLTGSPADIFSSGKQIKVPLLAGFNGAEESFFMSRSLEHGNAEIFKSAAEAKFGKASFIEFSKAYSLESDEDARSSAELLTGDLIISQQTWEWLQLHQQTGKSAVYGYQFHYRSVYSPVPAHLAEIKYVFGSLSISPLTPAVEPNQRDRELSDQMMSYWVNFAIKGDPNGEGLPQWPAYNANKPQVLIFSHKTLTSNEIGTQRFRFLQRLRNNGRLPEHWRND